MSMSTPYEPAAARTHEPSTRRVEQARSAGQLAVSRDLTGALVTLALGLALAKEGKAMVGDLLLFMRDALAHATSSVPAERALRDGVLAMASTLALPFAVMLWVGILIGVAQTRGLLRFRLARPEAHRLVPRLGRILSAQGLSAAGRALLRVAALGTVGALCFAWAAPTIFRLNGSDARHLGDAFFVVGKGGGLALAMALAGVGLTDYLGQRHRHRKALRMTWDEVKREHKETEGDPVLKAERKRIHAEWLDLVSLGELTRATVVVVVHPGQTALALRYERGCCGAPTVVRTRYGRAAARLESVAAQAGWSLVPDPALADALATVDEGEEIPESLHDAVAELFAHPVVDAETPEPDVRGTT